MKKIIAVFLMCLIFPLCADAYRRVDNHARRVPQGYNSSLEEIVKYLVTPYEKDEEKKARALFAWIIYHVDYDGYSYRVMKENLTGKGNPARQGVNIEDDIFETRLGLCLDIAELYKRMADLAGLESVLIYGSAGNLSSETPIGHVWNAVKINGQWEFVDATWGMVGRYQMLSNINSDNDFLREVEKRKRRKLKTYDTRNNRQIDNKWFKTDPAEMARTHKPNETKWLLLDDSFRNPNGNKKQK